MMKTLLILLVSCCFGLSHAWGESKLLTQLKQIEAINSIEALQIDGFNEYYQFRYRQPIDHNDPGKGYFDQLVCLGHKTFQSPVIVELEGYGLHSKEIGELTTLLEGNQLIIEHRFFESSVPKDRIPWEYLTLKQSATDHHQIIQSLKLVYNANKWITTGISKGGQTTIFHRYFYPNDVDVSVPYVAPFNLDFVDKRLERYLSNLGTTRKNVYAIFEGNADEGSDYHVRDFQEICFEDLDKMLPIATAQAQKNNYTFEHVGGIKRMLQLVILEFPFAFWQWGHSCADIPLLENCSVQERYDYLMKVSPMNFFDDQSIQRLYPFYYAALTEIGMYDYNIKPFKRFLDDKSNINFAFAYPKDAPKKEFNRKQLEEINEWLQSEASQMLFIYGANDPWSATAVELKHNDRCRKYIMADQDHRCRIKSFDMITQADLLATLKEWLNN